MKALLNITLQPSAFNKFTNALLPWLIMLSLTLFSAAIYYDFTSPIDQLHGELVRIMYIHVPSAWLALGLYLLVAIFSFTALVWRIKLAYIIAFSAAPIGAIFAFLTLVTGSIWGKPAWGTWWVWDARLTSMLILFLFYLCYILIVHTGDDKWRSEKPASVIAIFGLINLPIVKFSVEMWNSLHQNASVLRFGGPSIAPEMMQPLLLSFAALCTFTAIMIILRVQTYLIEEKL